MSDGHNKCDQKSGLVVHWERLSKTLKNTIRKEEVKQMVILAISEYSFI